MSGVRWWSEAANERLMLGVFGLASGAFAFGTWRTSSDPDFGAFYCGGRAVDLGADPYRLGFLAACEGKLHAVPSPLPGYDMAGFALLAQLPFQVANAVFLGLLVTAFVTTIVCLRRLTRAPLVLIAMVLFLTDGFLNVRAGQIAVIACACLALAALLAERKRYLLASVAALGILIEPHIGLAALIGAAVAVPKMRAALGLGVLGLGGLSLAALGRPENQEYILEVLPRHAISEIAHQGQLSLTAALHVAGAGDRVALLCGALSYLTMLTAGTFCALALTRRSRSAAFALTVPPAFALVGGTYLHVNQICLAIPAAFMIFERFPARRLQAGAALALLAVPWSAVKIIMPETLVAAAAAGVVIWYSGRNTWLSLAAGGAAALVLNVAYALIGPDDLRIASGFRSTIGPNGYADDEWRQYVAVAFSDHSGVYFWLHVLTWAGLGLLAYAALREAYRFKRPLYATRAVASDS